ncbi:BamA/OMP85 family outer membrane protein [Rhodopirellula sp. P2]|uniref:BamA/OMP85 family outer membrane protein n=1 Tax=Rhodopirellula sp. P2 TaxID=2127060 RepID=UPI00236855E2|nr:BamA/TamA family outer membrane protein [Rhodopirellula sp. P2]WDQ17290.1 BamA/TamA family outer membrane protein [Rhodopirellula sp. P2]
MNSKTTLNSLPLKSRFKSWMRAVTQSSESDPSAPSKHRTATRWLDDIHRSLWTRVSASALLALSSSVVSSSQSSAQTAYPAPPPPSAYGAPPSLQGTAAAPTNSTYGQSVYGGPSAYGAPGTTAPATTAPAPTAGNPYAAPTYGGNVAAPPAAYPNGAYQGQTYQGQTYQGDVYQGGTLPGPLQGSFPSSPSLAPPVVNQPTVREADLIIQGYPARTGRLMFGGAVNSDAGVTGQITVDERNFDISRWPTSFGDLFSGTAFRGAGQTFRLEAAPGSDYQRYTAQFADPNLLGYLPISMSLSGFLYDRNFDDWDENRLGGRASFGYRVTPDLSISLGVGGQNVEITDPRVNTVPELNSALGDNALFSGMASLIHDTRNSPLQPSRGHYFELSFEQTFGDYEYSTFEAEYRKYWLLRERADGSGKQTLSYSVQLGFSGDETPIFENYFAGGYATIRGFDFRGASPVINGVEVGGQFQWLNSVEYMFPLTADDAFRGVAFVDFGTVEQDIEIDTDNFRVAPGFGLRVAIPMLGPAPLAFDFAFPVAMADTDDERMFSFYMSAIR